MAATTKPANNKKPRKTYNDEEDLKTWRDRLATTPTDEQLETAKKIMKETYKKSLFNKYIKIRHRKTSIRVRIPASIKNVHPKEKNFVISEYPRIEDALQQAVEHRRLMSANIRRVLCEERAGLEPGPATKKRRFATSAQNGYYGTMTFREPALYFELKSIQNNKLHTNSFPISMTAIGDKRAIADTKKVAIQCAQDLQKQGIELQE